VVAEKVILKPAVALKSVVEAADDAKENHGGAGSKGAPPTPPKFKFVKNFGVADVIKFADGTKFQFRMIRRNTGGYQPNSFAVTDDEKLAGNLREASKNKALGIVEVK
jgi:hypothetical protein